MKKPGATFVAPGSFRLSQLVVVGAGPEEVAGVVATVPFHAVLTGIERDVGQGSHPPSRDVMDPDLGLALLVRMALRGITRNRIAMEFTYVRVRDGGEETVARGEQEIACMRRVGDRPVPVPPPAGLRGALQPFGAR